MTEEQIKLMNDTISGILCYKRGEWSRNGLIRFLEYSLKLPKDVVEHVNTIIDR